MSNKKLNATITIGGTVASSLKSAVGSAMKGVGGIGKEIEVLAKKQNVLTAATRQMGNELMRARKAKVEDAASVARLSETYTRLQAQLDKTRRAQERLVAAQERSKNIRAASGKVVSGASSAAFGIGAGAVAVGAMVTPMIHEAIKNQALERSITMMGFNKDQTKDLLHAGQTTQQFGVSANETKERLSDLAAAFGDAEHAVTALPRALKMDFALRNIAGGDAIEAQMPRFWKSMELLGGTANGGRDLNAMANMAFQQMAATKGNVNPEELFHAVQRGGVAVKSMDKEALFYHDTALLNEMGGDAYGTAMMTAYQALAQGKITRRAARNMEKFGLIADSSKVTHDKSGQLSFLNPGALKGYDIFVHDQQKWVDTILIPLLKSHGIDPHDKTKVSEALGSMMSDRKGSNLIFTRVTQSELVNKDADLTRQSADIDAQAEARRNSADGKMDEAHAQLENAEKNMGNVFLPVFADAMTSAAEKLRAFNDLAVTSPELFKALTGGLVAVVGGVTALTAAGVGSTVTTWALSTAVETMGLNAGGAAGRVASLAASFLGSAGLVVALSMVALQVAKILGLPDTDMAKGAKDIQDGNWGAASAHLPAFEFTRAFASHLRGVPNADIAMAVMDERSPNLPAPALPEALPDYKLPPSLPSRAGNGSAYGANTTVHVGGITVVQQPGEDGAALAKRMADELGRRASTQRRGYMFDTGAAH